MATQTHDGIPFSLLPEEKYEHCRLLELPPELLGILTADSPQALQFKSAEGPSAGAHDTQAAICTDNRTFSVRQVNTSNSLYLTQLKDVASHDESAIPSTGVQAVAKNDFALEVAPLPASPEKVKMHMKAALPIYSSTGQTRSKDLLTKDGLFANVPFSHMECHCAYEALACFQLENPRGCFIPSGPVKLQAWKSILEEAATHEIDLTAAFSQPQLVSLSSQINDLPPQLMQAVIRAITDDKPEPQEKLIEQQSCLKFIGLSQLETSTQERGSVLLSSFMSAWQGLLPEKWRNSPKLELLNGHYSLLNDGREITLAGSHTEQEQPSEPGKAAAAEGKSMLGAKRKWHEKFRASKKTA
ncbi:hypothetical protein KC363_g771 [Hortaea werneckii]|uniref:Sister chromatid cohesion protein DCC1 n=1 Tax=Hortaea werneckii TaxID=91943 RepID=A0A3M7G368_HORWE|nr:hypothetical protein KC361_g1960 [Hortaea werneckii]KAI6886974.1 hypothetical protein KC325_g2426 [Hortaea werneckii]KAI6997543.1 hypothetical protein KC359_g2902 [Hortaea werneckii]KAI7089924.1 hypothetical protein KC356_g2024 [Hortaea werneckii]KAI7148339.1 hypothetical protein KC344_g2053 [Hortaea werneckii]